jgi:hypothetical protein
MDNGFFFIGLSDEQEGRVNFFRQEILDLIALFPQERTILKGYLTYIAKKTGEDTPASKIPCANLQKLLLRSGSRYFRFRAALEFFQPRHHAVISSFAMEAIAENAQGS